MADVVSKQDRSRMMSAVRGANTRPEVLVRKALHADGFRFRLHQRDLPGRPDITLPRYKVAIFVNGCFWHGHYCRRGRLPLTNLAFWQAKITKNVERDRAALLALTEAGWLVEILWTCDLQRGIKQLLERLRIARSDRLH